jgi:hypothetical protein
LTEPLAEKRISCEILEGAPQSAEHIVRLFFVKNPESWFTREDVMKHLKKHGKTLKVGSFYNLTSKLMFLGFIESKRSSIALYRLKPLRCENHG